MLKNLSPSIQDYLKHIYDLEQGEQPVTTVQLAQRLNVAPASVTGMMQKLASCRPPLVIYRKHQGVTLTQAGRRVALEVIRHHRLLETYLVRVLGYGWDEVHDEACRLEHVISEDFERRIAEALGHPLRDPHGEVIPTPDLRMPADPSAPLHTLHPGQQAVIRRVDAQDPALLRYIATLGLTPGVLLQVMAVSAFDQILTIQVGRQSLVLGQPITSRIFVELLPAE